MKKLSKINISAEKVLGNEELVNLRGGNEPSTYYECSCTNGPKYPNVVNPYCDNFTDPLTEIPISLASHCINGEGTCSKGCKLP